jgi:hypothetical protein
MQASLQKKKASGLACVDSDEQVIKSCLFSLWCFLSCWLDWIVPIILNLVHFYPSLLGTMRIAPTMNNSKPAET